MPPTLRYSYALIAASLGASFGASSCCGLKARPTAHSCRESHEVDATTKASLRSAANSVVAALRKDDDKAILEKMHSELGGATDPLVLSQLVLGIHELLDPTSPPVLSDLRLATLTNATAQTSVFCGSGDNEKDSHLRTVPGVAGVKELGMVRLDVAKGTRTDALYIHFVREGGDWKIVRLHANVVAMGGNSASVFEERGDVHRDAARLLDAMANYQVAASFSAGPKGVSTGAQIRLRRKLEELAGSKAYTVELEAIGQTPHPVVVFRQKVRVLTDGVVPTFNYVTKHALTDEAAIKAEADPLKTLLSNAHPSFETEFDKVAFEATPKVVPYGKAYKYYRVVIPLQPR